MSKGCVTFIINWAFTFIGAWSLMLGIGVVHAHVLPAVYPAGYGTSLLVLVLFGGAFWFYAYGVKD